ncbi:MAG: hypothetical protein AAGI51_16490, partial [Pseudomonadota bacterium]
MSPKPDEHRKPETPRKRGRSDLFARRRRAAREDYDPGKLTRFMIYHIASGVAAGWVVMLALIWLDIGGVGSLIRGSDQRELVTAMMAAS